jgi:hypothetical protein
MAGVIGSAMSKRLRHQREFLFGYSASTDFAVNGTHYTL